MSNSAVDLYMIKNGECPQCQKIALEANKKGDVKSFVHYAVPGKLRKVSESNDGFSYSKALAGTLVFGSVGAVAGINGKKKVLYRCDKCGFETTMTE